MNDYQRTELEAEWGAATAEQNAFALSRMETQLDDPRITEEVNKGRHVVISCSDVFCPATDAYIGVGVSLEKSFETREEAVQMASRLNEEFGESLWFESRSPGEVEEEPTPVFQYTDSDQDDVPF